MSRRRYVVAYDIRDSRRLHRVHKTMKSFGYALQYSVFVCDLDNIEKYELLERVGDIISHDVDSVAVMDLGDVSRRGQECFEFLGRHRPLPTRGPQIV